MPVHTRACSAGRKCGCQGASWAPGTRRDQHQAGDQQRAGPAPGGTSSRQGWGTSPRCRSLPGPNPESPMWWGRIQSEKMDNDHQDEGTGEGRGHGRDVPTREAPRAREARAHPAGARGRRSGNTLSRRRRRLRAAGTGTFFLILTLNLKSFQQECTIL